MNACGHIRCETRPCEWARPPALEQISDPLHRRKVRDAFADNMVVELRSDPEWSLHLAKLTTLDGTR